MVCVVIMAGGRGERFWPKSRVEKPKQFTDLIGEGNMLHLTYKRVTKIVEPENIFVITGREYQSITRKSIPELPEENIMIEPEGRNTAPCIGLASVILRKRFGEATMIVLPADHLIKEEDKFIDALKIAIELARNTDGLVTLGVKPTRPETGYGYLKTAEPIDAGRSIYAYSVAKFIEKPDAKKAEKLLEEGCYLWNCGIFIWKISTILNAFKEILPDMYGKLTRIGESLGSIQYLEVLNEVYPECEKVSIDYGIMEKAKEVYTIPTDFCWDDVGTWKALERIFGTDNDGNLFRGKVMAHNAVNTLVDAGNRLVALVGVEDLIVVDTEDITFICHKNHTDSVRELLDELRKQRLEEYL